MVVVGEEKGYIRVINARGETIGMTKDWQIPPDGFDYIVFWRGSKAYVKNGRTGQIEYTESDLYRAIVQAIRQLEQSGGGVVRVATAKHNINYIVRPLKNGVDLQDITFRFSRLFRPNIDRDRITLLRLDFDGDIFAGTNVIESKLTSAGSSPTYSVSNDRLIVTNDTGGSSAEDLLIYTPPACVIGAELTVLSHTATLGSTAADARIVLAKDVDNRIHFAYNTYAKRFEVYKKVNGSGTTAWTYDIELQPPYRLIWLLAGTTFFMLYEKDGIIHYLGSYECTDFDFLDPTVLSQFRIGFGQHLSDGISIEYGHFEVFIHSGFGAKDPVIVTYRDGVTPVIRDNKIFVALDCSGKDGKSSYQTVWAVDLNTLKPEFKGIILYRNPDDGKLYLDHPTHIVYDEVENEYKLVISGWSRYLFGVDSATRVLYATTKQDVLSNAVTIVDAVPLDLPHDPNDGQYDACVRYDPEAGKWRIVYANPYGTIVVAENSEMTTTGWTEVASFSSQGIEGPKFAKVNGKLYVVIADEVNGMSYLDYPTLTNRRTLNVDKFPHVETTPPHPAIVAVPSSETTKYLMISFDKAKGMPNTNSSWGNVWIYEGDKVAEGYENPVVY